MKKKEILLPLEETDFLNEKMRKGSLIPPRYLWYGSVNCFWFYGSQFDLYEKALIKPLYWSNDKVNEQLMNMKHLASKDSDISFSGQKHDYK